MLAAEFNFTINCAVADPIHGKYMVDGLNACKKQYLKQMMMIITFPGNRETIG